MAHRTGDEVPVLESLEPRVLLSAAMETWSKAGAGPYIPSDSKLVAVSGDLGKWLIEDTVSSFPECGPTGNYAQVVGGALRLHADESDPNFGCADNIWAVLFKGADNIPINGSKAIPFDAQSTVSFDVEGKLDDPEQGWSSGIYYDSIRLSLETKSGLALDYVFDRHPDRTANSAHEHHGLDHWREVFLDLAGGSYERNLFADFSTIPDFSADNPSANDLLIHSIDFEVVDTGWGAIDNVRIGIPLALDAPDLVGELAGVSLPTSLISGVGGSGKLTVKVDNAGFAAVPRSRRVDLHAVARPRDGGPDVDLGTAPNQSLSNLAPGRSKTVSVNVQVPASLADGDYDILVFLDSQDDLVESDESNNTVSLPTAGFTVSSPFHDLVGTLVDPKIPATMVSGDGTRISLPVNVRNVGNVPLARSQKIDLSIVARPVGGGTDIPVATITDQSVSALRPGADKKITCKTALPAGIPTGQYRLVVEVDCNDAVAESDESNNEAVSATFQPELGEIDLTGSFAKASLPSAIVQGVGASGKVQVVIGNEGNVSVAKGQKIDIQLVLRPDDGGADVHLATAAGASISGLKPGKSKSATLSAAIAAATPAGNYHLVAIVDSDDDVANEPDDDNNEIVGPPVIIAPPHRDLAGSLAKPKIPAVVISGDGTQISLPVNVKNHGNKALARNQKIDLTVVARPVGGGPDVPTATITGQSVSNLKPDGSKKFNIKVTLPAGIPTGTYDLVVLIDSGDDVAESNELNNEVVSPPLRVELGQIDLTGAFSGMALPSAIVEGVAASGKVRVIVTNDGNVPVAKGQQIDVALVLRPDNGGPDVVIAGASGASVSNLGPGRSKPITMAAVISDTASVGDYRLVAIVDSTDEVENERHEDNNQVVGGPIRVAEPFVDLAGEIVDVTLPTSFVAGTNAGRGVAKVTVANIGNIAIPGTPAPLAKVVFTPAGGGQTIELGSATISKASLQPGGSSTVSISLAAPATVPTGEYHLSVILDDGDVVAESDESNNSLAHEGTWIATAPPADLILASSTVSAKIYGDKIFYVTDTVRNSGGATDRSSRLSYYLSRDGKLDDDDHDLGSRTVPALAGGASSTQSTRLSTRGMINPFDFALSYRIIVVVDDYNQVDEGSSGESNNEKVYSTKFMSDQ